MHSALAGTFIVLSIEQRIECPVSHPRWESSGHE